MSEYTVDQILQAKRVAREAGYDVKLPDDRIEQAKNIAKAHGYDVRKANPNPRVNRDDISKALEVVTNAGLTVRKGNGLDNINNNTNRNVPPQPKPNVQNRPAPAKPAEPQHSWAERIASKYL